MTELDTRRRIVQVIVQHYLEGGEGRLTIQVASTRAGISRQAFNRYYDDLKPYVLGQRPAVDLLEVAPNNLQLMLVKCQVRIHELQDEVSRLHAERDSYAERLRHDYISTLMNSDIALHNSVELGKTVEKQALHNDKLIKDIQNLKVELALAKAQNVARDSLNIISSEEQKNVVSFDPDLSIAFRNYFRKQDVDVFEDEKADVIEKAVKKISKACSSGCERVVIFVDRYMCEFKKYYAYLIDQGLKDAIVVRAPLHNPVEIKSFVKKISAGLRVELHVPVCTSDIVLKAQRKFLFQETPAIEFDSADKMALPTINQMFSKIVFYRIEQGD
ncbi:hypothetical protein ACWV27_12885 [Massilia varians]